MMTPKEILMRAIALLNTEGWVQGHFHTAQGYCAIGALRTAAFGGFEPRPSHENDAAYMTAIDRVGAVIAEGSRYHALELAAWNDRRGRIKQDVISAFEQAASAEED